MVYLSVFMVSVCIGVLSGMRVRVAGLVIVIVISLGALLLGSLALGFETTATISFLALSAVAIQLGYALQVLVLDARLERLRSARPKAAPETGGRQHATATGPKHRSARR